jgi:probable HAF family extracellular repeat protein
MMSGYAKASVFAGWLIFWTPSVLAQAQLVDLGEATGYAINNAGQVVLSTGIYSNGTLIPLPALPDSTTPATGLAINASGQVAGEAQPGPGSANSCGVPIEYSGGTLINLLGPSACAEADPSVGPATGINSSGTVIGWDEAEIFSHGETTTFTYSNGALTIIDVPCSLSPAGIFSTKLCAPDANVFGNIPYAINDSGEVVGTISLLNSTFGPCAYVASNGVWTCLGQGTAYAINASGQVTGSLVGANADPTDTSHAFLYSNGTTTSLGTLPGGRNSTGYAINATGQIVGSSDFTGSKATTHAFFYNGVTIDLNSLISATDPLKPDVTLTSAVGINDSSLILAKGVDSRTGDAHAYLYQASLMKLTPPVLNFTQAVGGTSQAQSVAVSNAGTTAIPFGLPSVNGDFSLTADNCGASLAPSDQCRISVVFVPKVAGVLTGALTIPSGGANYQVPLSGVAPITAKISASSSTALVGQPVTLTWAVSAGSTCSAGSSSTNTAWTSSKPRFTGTVPASGKQPLTEIVAGDMNYFLACTAPGVATVNVSTSVVWDWLPVTASISASPTTITAGQSTTLTWKSSNATSCTATGGGLEDKWAGTKAASGSQKVTEAVALDASTVLTFGITCNSTTSGLSADASASVTENPASATSGSGPAPAGSGGGGGALNPMSLAFLAAIFALRRMRVRRFACSHCHSMSFMAAISAPWHSRR